MSVTNGMIGQPVIDQPLPPEPSPLSLAISTPPTSLGLLNGPIKNGVTKARGFKINQLADRLAKRSLKMAEGTGETLHLGLPPDEELKSPLSDSSISPCSKSDGPPCLIEETTQAAKLGLTSEGDSEPPSLDCSTPCSKSEHPPCLVEERPPQHETTHTSPVASPPSLKKHSPLGSSPPSLTPQKTEPQATETPTPSTSLLGDATSPVQLQSTEVQKTEQTTNGVDSPPPPTLEPQAPMLEPEVLPRSSSFTALSHTDDSTKPPVVRTRSSPRSKKQAPPVETKGKPRTARRSKRLVETSTQTADVKFISVGNEEKTVNGEILGSEPASEPPVLKPAVPIVPPTYICLFCQLTFVEKTDCLTHEATHTLKRKTKFIMCQFCFKKLPNLEDFKSHCSKHHGPNFYLCSECDLRFYDSNSLGHHTKTEHPAERTHFNIFNKRVKTSGSNLDIDVNCDVNKKPSISPRGGQKTSPKEKTEEQLYESEMLFYTHLSGKIQENLSNHLDGKIDRIDSVEVVDTLKCSSGLLAVASNSSNGGPTVCRAPSPYQTRSKTPNPLPTSAKKFKKLPNWQQKFWEKYNFPTNYRFEHRFWDKNYISAEKSPMYLKDLSCLDIKTQLTMRENVKKLEQAPVSEPENASFPAFLGLVPVPVAPVMAEPASPSLELVKVPKKKSRDNKNARKSRYTPENNVPQVVTRRQSCMDVARQRKGSLDMGGNSKTGLRRQASEESPLKPVEIVEPEPGCSKDVQDDLEPYVEKSDISGEWVRPRSYLCGACCAKFNNLWDLEDHKWAIHPNVWCTHYEFDVEKLDKIFHLDEEQDRVKKIALHDLYKRSLCTEGSLQQADIIDGATFPFPCSKCRKSCLNQAEMHRHILDCGGDTTWSQTMCASPATMKRRWRPYGSRRRKPTAQRGVKRTITSTPPLRTYITQPKIRTKPGDIESIQKMLANLPEKRTRRAINFDEISTRSQTTIQNNRLLRKRLTSFSSTLTKKVLSVARQRNRVTRSEDGNSQNRKFRLKEVTVDVTPIEMPPPSMIPPDRLRKARKEPGDVTATAARKRRDVRIKVEKLPAQYEGETVSNKDETQPSAQVKLQTRTQKKPARNRRGYLIQTIKRKLSKSQKSIEERRRSNRIKTKEEFTIEEEVPIAKLKEIKEEEIPLAKLVEKTAPVEVLKVDETEKVPENIKIRVVRRKGKGSKRIVTHKVVSSVPKSLPTVELVTPVEILPEENITIIPVPVENSEVPSRTLKRKKRVGKRRSAAKKKSILSSVADSSIGESTINTQKTEDTSIDQVLPAVVKCTEITENKPEVSEKVSNNFVIPEKLCTKESKRKNRRREKKNPLKRLTVKLKEPTLVLSNPGIPLTPNKWSSVSQWQESNPFSIAKSEATQPPEENTLVLKLAEVAIPSLVAEKDASVAPTQSEATLVETNEAIEKVLDEPSEVPTLPALKPKKTKKRKRAAFAKRKRGTPKPKPAVEHTEEQIDVEKLVENIIEKPLEGDLAANTEVLSEKSPDVLARTSAKSVEVPVLSENIASKPNVVLESIEVLKLESTSVKLNEVHEVAIDKTAPKITRNSTGKSAEVTVKPSEKRTRLPKTIEVSEVSGVPETPPVIRTPKSTRRALAKIEVPAEVPSPVKTTDVYDFEDELENPTNDLKLNDSRPKLHENRAKSPEKPEVVISAPNEDFSRQVPEELPKVHPVQEAIVEPCHLLEQFDVPLNLSPRKSRRVSRGSATPEVSSDDDRPLCASRSKRTLPKPALQEKPPLEIPKPVHEEKQSDVSTTVHSDEEAKSASQEPLNCVTNSTDLVKSMKPIFTIEEATSSEDAGKPSSSCFGPKIAEADSTVEKVESSVADGSAEENKSEPEMVVSSTIANPAPGPSRRRKKRSSAVEFESKDEVPSSTLVIPEELDRRSRRKSKEVRSTNEFIIDDPLLLVDELWSDLDSDSDSKKKKIKRVKKKTPKKRVPPQASVDLEELLRNFGEKKEDLAMKCLPKPRKDYNGPSSRQRLQAKVPMPGKSRLSLKLLTFKRKVWRYGRYGLKLMKVKKDISMCPPSLPSEVLENPVQVIVCRSKKKEKTVKKEESKVDFKISLPLELIGDLSILNNNHLPSVETREEPKPAEPKTKRSDVIDKVFYCETCNTYYYSSSQLKNHKASNRHKQNELSKQEASTAEEAETKEESEPVVTSEVPAPKDLDVSMDVMASEMSVPLVPETVILPFEDKNEEDTSEMPVLEGPFIEARPVEPVLLTTETAPLPTEPSSSSSPPEIFKFSEESLKDIQKAIGCTDEEMLILTLLGENTTPEPDILDLSNYTPGAVKTTTAKEPPESSKTNGVIKVDLKQRMTTALASLVNRAVVNLLSKTDSVSKISEKSDALAFLNKLSMFSGRSKSLISKEAASDVAAKFQASESANVQYQYKCQFCGNRFEKESTRDCHIQRSHNRKKKIELEEPLEEWHQYTETDADLIPGQQQFRCSECGINFTSPREVSDHQKAAHSTDVTKADGETRASGVAARRVSNLDPDQEKLMANQELQKLAFKRTSQRRTIAVESIKYRKVENLGRSIVRRPVDNKKPLDVYEFDEFEAEEPIVLTHVKKATSDVLEKEDPPSSLEKAPKTLAQKKEGKKVGQLSTITQLENREDEKIQKGKNVLESVGETQEKDVPLKVSVVQEVSPSPKVKAGGRRKKIPARKPARRVTNVKNIRKNAKADDVGENISKEELRDSQNDDDSLPLAAVQKTVEVPTPEKSEPPGFKISLENKFLRLGDMKSSPSGSEEDSIPLMFMSRKLSDSLEPHESFADRNQTESFAERNHTESFAERNHTESLAERNRTESESDVPDCVFKEPEESDKEPDLPDSDEDIGDNVIYQHNDSLSSFESDSNSEKSEKEETTRRHKRILPSLSATLTDASNKKPGSPSQQVVNRVWNKPADFDEDVESDIDKEMIMKKVWKKKKEVEKSDGERSEESLKIEQTEVSNEVVIKCGPKEKAQNRRKSLNEPAKDAIVRRIWSGKCAFQTKAALKTYDSDIVPPPPQPVVPEDPPAPAKRRVRASASVSKRKRVSSVSEDDLDSLLDEIEQENVEKAIRLEFLQSRRSEKNQAEVQKEPSGLFSENSPEDKFEKPKKKKTLFKRSDLELSRRHRKHRHRHHHHKHKHKKSKHHRDVEEKHKKRTRSPSVGTHEPPYKVLERMCEDMAASAKKVLTPPGISADLDTLDQKLDEILLPSRSASYAEGSKF